jgi:tryptophan-rich sensory protein
MQELGQRLCQLVMQFSFFDFYQIYGKMLKVKIRPKLTPNEQVLLQVWNSLLVLPGTAAQ